MKKYKQNLTKAKIYKPFSENLNPQTSQEDWAQIKLETSFYIQKKKIEKQSIKKRQKTKKKNAHKTSIKKRQKRKKKNAHKTKGWVLEIKIIP